MGPRILVRRSQAEICDRHHSISNGVDGGRIFICFFPAQAASAAFPFENPEQAAQWIEDLKNGGLAAREKALFNIERHFNPVLERKLKDAVQIERSKADPNKKFLSQAGRVLRTANWSPEMRELERRLSWELKQIRPDIVEMAFSTNPAAQLLFLTDLNGEWSRTRFLPSTRGN